MIPRGAISALSPAAAFAVLSAFWIFTRRRGASFADPKSESDVNIYYSRGTLISQYIFGLILRSFLRGRNTSREIGQKEMKGSVRKDQAVQGAFRKVHGLFPAGGAAAAYGTSAAEVFCPASCKGKRPWDDERTIGGPLAAREANRDKIICRKTGCGLAVHGFRAPPRPVRAAVSGIVDRRSRVHSAIFFAHALPVFVRWRDLLPRFSIKADRSPRILRAWQQDGRASGPISGHRPPLTAAEGEPILAPADRPIQNPLELAEDRDTVGEAPLKAR